MPPPKVCPRCGAQYENLKSTTCPQCFAKLVEVDEPFAAELSQARAEVEQSPEFQAVKAADDERFREQSFGACLSVAVITLITVVVAVVLIVGAVRHNRQARHVSPVIVRPAPVKLSTLPIADAKITDVLPSEVGEEKGGGPYFLLHKSDADVTLPGTTVPIFHAKYRIPTISYYSHPEDLIVDVYAVPAGLPTEQENNFLLGMTLAAGTGPTKPKPVFFATEHWHYAAISGGGYSEVFRDTLLSQMAH